MILFVQQNEALPPHVLLACLYLRNRQALYVRLRVAQAMHQHRVLSEQLQHLPLQFCVRQPFVLAQLLDFAHSLVVGLDQHLNLIG